MAEVHDSYTDVNDLRLRFREPGSRLASLKVIQ